MRGKDEGRRPIQEASREGMREQWPASGTGEGCGDRRWLSGPFRGVSRTCHVAGSIGSAEGRVWFWTIEHTVVPRASARNSEPS